MNYLLRIVAPCNCHAGGFIENRPIHLRHHEAFSERRHITGKAFMKQLQEIHGNFVALYFGEAVRDGKGVKLFP